MKHTLSLVLLFFALTMVAFSQGNHQERQANINDGLAQNVQSQHPPLPTQVEPVVQYTPTQSPNHVFVQPQPQQAPNNPWGPQSLIGIISTALMGLVGFSLRNNAVERRQEAKERREDTRKQNAELSQIMIQLAGVEKELKAVKDELDTLRERLYNLEK